MRELTVVGLDVDGKHIICESKKPAERFLLPADDRLRAAVRGEAARSRQSETDIEVASVLSPKEIQARIRAGASVEQSRDAEEFHHLVKEDPASDPVAIVPRRAEQEVSAYGQMLKQAGFLEDVSERPLVGRQERAVFILPHFAVDLANAVDAQKTGDAA